jgi:intracellular septation protein
MQALLDFLPVIAFFVAYKLADIYVATGVAIAAGVLLIGISLVRRQPIKPVQWISLGFILVFGLATILLHDEYYIKLKWTLFYGLMSVLILGALAFGKNPLKTLLGNEIDLPPDAWRRLTVAWGLFFLLLAGLNHYFAHTLSLDAWVKVKVFGGMAITLLFVLVQAAWISTLLPKEEKPSPP